MPAAKIEKTNSVDQQPDVEGKTDVNNNTNANINCYQESIKVANTIIEKKIRNLEKRKVCLWFLFWNIILRFLFRLACLI